MTQCSSCQNLQVIFIVILKSAMKSLRFRNLVYRIFFSDQPLGLRPRSVLLWRYSLTVALHSRSHDLAEVHVGVDEHIFEHANLKFTVSDRPLNNKQCSYASVGLAQARHLYSYLLTLSASREFMNVWPVMAAQLQVVCMKGLLYKRQRGQRSKDLQKLKFQERFCQLTATAFEYYKGRKVIICTRIYIVGESHYTDFS